MIVTLLVILLGLWAFGLVTSYTMGGVIHVLLVLAIALILFRDFQSRGVVDRL